MRQLLIAAEKLTARLRALQKMQLQYRDMGMTQVEFNVAELFEPADLEALAAFESAKSEALGQQPLPMEISI